MIQTMEIRPLAHSREPEVIIPLPRDLGCGHVLTADLDSGLNLIISNYNLNRRTCLSYACFPPVLGFGFCLSGQIESRIQGVARPDTIQAGKSAVFHLDAGNMEETVETDRVLRVNIMLDPDKCSQILGRYSEQLSPVLEKVFDARARAFTALTPAMHAAVLQILDCRLTGVARHLFLKGKAMELMALKLGVVDEVKTWGKKGPLKDNDFKRVRKAARLLVHDLENPPDLSELSRHAGMCQSKLHKCFKQVYGMTPFDYLRSKRMEKAEALLRKGRHNVTQAAGAVGYSSLSHFSKAFKQAYGYLPGKCSQNRFTA